MIISRAPFRISLGGGGTDLPSYYKKYGGFLISGAINKYMFVGANRQFYDKYLIRYSKTENVETVDDIKHPLIREALRLLKIPTGIEVTSLADVAAGTGVGSSGAFLISLLNTLYHYKNENVTKRQLAEDACKIELEILREHEGKQDKYATAFGGIKSYKFNRNGSVDVISLSNEDIIMKKLEQHLLLFFTGQRRDKPASEALKNQDIKTKSNDQDMLQALHQIRDIGIETKYALQNKDFDKFGNLLNEHWQIKKHYSPHSTNEFVDKCYKTAMNSGALGGKIMGAGGGGFFMFYYPEDDETKINFIDIMLKLGLHHTPFKFDTMGVTVITKEELE